MKQYICDIYTKIEERAKSNQTFVEFEHDKLTYRSLLKFILRFNYYSKKKQIEKNSIFLIVSSNEKYVIQLLISSIILGYTPVILSADIKSKRLRGIIEKTNPVLIFIDQKILDSISWLEEFNYLLIPKERKTIIAVFKQIKLHPKSILNVLKATAKLYTKELFIKNNKALAFISFTSGTTSQPKGVMTTYENLFEHLETIMKLFNYNESSKIFNNLVLAHNDGFVQGPLISLFSGATLYRPSAFTINNLETLLNSIYSRRITHLITVPTILSLIDKLTFNNDYFIGENFKNIISVADKIDSTLWSRLEKRFKIRICNIYGLTETVAGGLFCGPNDNNYLLGTVGKTIDIEAKIINHNNIECKNGEEGELLLKGNNITPGYYMDFIATNDLFNDGWLKTGDIASKDRDGFYKIMGRKKSVIISGGINIHPDEINEVLLNYKGVIGATTIGIDDLEWGELVVSAIESKNKLLEIDLFEHCRKHLEQIKVPKRIIVLDELPRGISRKVNLSEVKEIISKKLEPQRDKCIKGNCNKNILEVVSEVFKIPSNKLSLKDTNQSIKSWDSLGHLNLITTIEEKFNIKFSIDEMIKADSLKELSLIVNTKLK
jgi:long-chain acyl-CoA synthetase